jgi:hypothetical protein
MKNLSGIFLKSFAFFTALFLIPQLLTRIFSPVYIHGAIYPTLEYVLISRLIIGFISAVVATLIQFLYVRRQARKNNLNYDTLDYGVHQTLEIEVAKPSSSIIEALKNHLPTRWEITDQDSTKGLLKFKVFHRWQIPYDLVTVQLLTSDPQRTFVKVESKMNTFLKLLDNGNNLSNVQQVRRILSQ